MEITINSPALSSEIVKNIEGTEYGFYKAVGEVLPKLVDSIPTTLSAYCSSGIVKFDIKKRGAFIRDGVTYPSMYVSEVYNDVILPRGKETYQDTYLTCINAESNNYKFYHLKPRVDGIHATYGRIGTNKGEMFGVRDLQTPYPSRMYWIRYYEKLSKGYQDQTDIFLKSKKLAPKQGKKPKEKVNPVNAELYQTLMAYARYVVKNTLLSEKVTESQVKFAKLYLKEAGKRKTVTSFNHWLSKVLVLSPRKERYIHTLLAKTKEEFSDIIKREENLIAAMEALVSEGYADGASASFEEFGIEVFEATKEQEQKILSKLSEPLQKKVAKIWRVIPKRQKERFDKYLKQENIKVVKELWHGSRNENWASIVQNSLQLYPNAIITGKMFGQGIYFAPSSAKSFNYTSCRGTTWANGRDDVGFMGVFAVAYGSPHDVDVSEKFTQQKLNGMQRNCVHAHAGKALLNDEIIFYDEAAVCLNYIVQFSAN